MEAIFLLGSAHGGVQRPLRPLSGFHQPWSTPVQAGHPPPLCVLEFATNSGHSVRAPPPFWGDTVFGYLALIGLFFSNFEEKIISMFDWKTESNISKTLFEVEGISTIN